MAGFSAAGKIQNIFATVFTAFGATIATYVGQNRGAGKMDRVKQGVRYTQMMVLGWSVFVMFLMFFFGKYLTYLFVDPSEQDVVNVSVTYFRTVFWAYPFLGSIFLYRNTLQGMGYGLVPMLGGVFELVESDPQKGVALKVEWNEPKLGEDTTFHVSADGGSGRYLFRMDAPSYSNPGEYSFESVADPSRGAWIQYTDECESHDFEFTMTASGVYNFRFYVMDKTSGVYYMRVSTNIQVSDKAYPSVGDIVNAAVKKCSKETDGSDYEKALWLHDWLLQQLD